ncbi:MAG: amino acid permease [Alphaproteobacteria bacterium]|nr:amino acid permease [Alphaproteobacteria bacterium]
MSDEKSADDQALIDAGYTPRLQRSLGSFASFAIGFSDMSVLMGIFANFGYMLGKAGPFGTWTWPAVGCGQFLVALVFAELSGRVPLTGAIYNWNSKLFSPRIGWFTAWMLFLAYCIGGAGIITAIVTPLQTLLGVTFDATTLDVVGCAIILSHMAINIYGVRLAASLNKLAVVAEIVALALFGGALLAVVLLHGEARIDLLTAVPKRPLPYWPGFLLASLLAAWTIIGFELPSDLSEETKNAKNIAPRSILSAVISSVILGGLFLAILILAIPDVARITASPDPISAIVAYHLGGAATKIFLVFVLIAMFALALLVMAATARILYAVARDERIPGAARLASVSKHKVPAPAIFLVTAIELAIFLTARSATDLYAATTVLFFIAYLITVVGFANGFGKLPPEGGFSLGKWRMPVVALAALWLAFMIGVLTIPAEFHRAAEIAAVVLVAGLALAFGIRSTQTDKPRDFPVP